MRGLKKVALLGDFWRWHDHVNEDVGIFKGLKTLGLSGQ